jgi:hypothetical protein
MSSMECLREQEILEAVNYGRYSEELKAHASQCAVCSDVVQVATVLREDLEGGLAYVRVPSAGLVWWRAEIRSRQDAMRTASRPITWVQAFGGACTAGVGIALLSRAWPWLKHAITQIDISTLSFAQWSLLLAAALALLIIGPLAMYLVLSDE